MTSAEFLNNFMPGDVIQEVKGDGTETGIIIVFSSGYEFKARSGWKWEASAELIEEQRRHLPERIFDK